MAGKDSRGCMLIARDRLPCRYSNRRALRPITARRVAAGTARDAGAQGGLPGEEARRAEGLPDGSSGHWAHSTGVWLASRAVRSNRSSNDVHCRAKGGGEAGQSGELCTCQGGTVAAAARASLCFFWLQKHPHHARGSCTPPPTNRLTDA